MIPFSSQLVTRLPFMLGLVTPQQVLIYNPEVIVTVVSQPTITVAAVEQPIVTVDDLSHVEMKVSSL